MNNPYTDKFNPPRYWNISNKTGSEIAIISYRVYGYTYDLSFDSKAIVPSYHSEFDLAKKNALNRQKLLEAAGLVFDIYIGKITKYIGGKPTFSKGIVYNKTHVKHTEEERVFRASSNTRPKKSEY